MSSTSTVKGITFIFHAICALLALVLISFGIFFVCDYDVEEYRNIAGFAYIILGSGTLVVLLLGLSGAIRESVCCTVTFIVLLWIVIIAQVLISTFLLIKENEIASHLANSLDKVWEEELTNPGAMSIYENWLQCCGRASPHDYIVSDRLPPDTCFQNNDASKSENLIGVGCRVKFEEYSQNLLHIANIIAYVLIALEIIGSAVSCYLCNNIRNDHRRSYY